jgi:hypothetical protein
MKEKELREIIRNQIIQKMNEEPSRFAKDVSGVRGLGRAKSGLDKSLSRIDTSAISKLGRSQKIKLLTSLLSNAGITAQDFAAIKNAVGRNLAGTIAPADESIQEADDDYELQKAKGGVTSRDLGGASAINRAKPFLSAINSLSGTDKQKAIGYVLSQMGVNAQDFDGMKTQLKTSIRKYK